MGSHIVVLSSHDAAVDLLERRSAVYSDRVRERFDVSFKLLALTGIPPQPRLPMVKELWVFSSLLSITTPANDDLFQDGRFLVLPCDGVREYLAHSP